MQVSRDKNPEAVISANAGHNVGNTELFQTADVVLVRLCREVQRLYSMI